MSKRKTKYARIGEHVILEQANAFLRVGYPYMQQDVEMHPELSKEVEETVQRGLKAMFPESVKAAYGLLGSIALQVAPTAIYCSVSHKIETPIKKAVVYSILQRLNFGGNKRQVYEVVTQPDIWNHAAKHVGEHWEVVAKRFVKTGTRHNGWTHTSYDGEIDGGGPELTDELNHCIYTLKRWHGLERITFITLAKNTRRVHEEPTNKTADTDSVVTLPGWEGLGESKIPVTQKRLDAGSECQQAPKEII